jgi:hypothetical protein
MILFVQCVIACLLFTLALLVQIKKNDPIKALYNYPPKIQERVKSLKEYEGQIPTKSSKVSSKLKASVVVVVIGVILCKLANTEGFLSTFKHMFILFSVVNLYDLIVIDWIFFCHLKIFRIPGTEDMVKEYHNYGFHLIASLRGMVLGLVVSALVGLITIIV